MKRIISLIIVIVAAFMFTIPLSAAEKGIVKVDVYINGEKLQTTDTPRIINDTTYVPLRAVCELFGADDISWDGRTNTAKIKARGIEIYVTTGKTYIIANGRYFASTQPIKNIDDRLYVPVRLIASAFASDVEWNGNNYSVRIKDYNRALTSGEEYYDKNDLYWLSRIIEAESGIEPFMGKIAVGNVIQNRARSSEYPSTIYGVIFDKKFGVQFTPAASGSIYNTPREDSVIAAKICLEGFSLNEDVLYFMNPKLATSSWISENREFAFNIGGHDFYY